MDRVLVVGGSSGIGYDLSYKFSEQGFDVFATSGYIGQLLLPVLPLYGLIFKGMINKISK